MFAWHLLTLWAVQHQAIDSSGELSLKSASCNSDFLAMGSPACEKCLIAANKKKYLAASGKECHFFVCLRYMYHIVCISYTHTLKMYMRVPRTFVQFIHFICYFTRIYV